MVKTTIKSRSHLLTVGRKKLNYRLFFPPVLQRLQNEPATLDRCRREKACSEQSTPAAVDAAIGVAGAGPGGEGRAIAEAPRMAQQDQVRPTIFFGDLCLSLKCQFPFFCVQDLLQPADTQAGTASLFGGRTSGTAAAAAAAGAGESRSAAAV